MSYDLMVFDIASAPDNKEDFMLWYDRQTRWEEDHSYHDPVNTSEPLKKWFMEMQQHFLPLNGPYSKPDIDNDTVTDYTIGNHVIYAAFRFSVAEEAYNQMFANAKKYHVGFFDASGSGDIWITDDSGNYIKMGSKKRKRASWKFW